VYFGIHKKLMGALLCALYCLADSISPSIILTVMPNSTDFVAPFAGVFRHPYFPIQPNLNRHAEFISASKKVRPVSDAPCFFVMPN
jgi:hypothetical protein